MANKLTHAERRGALEQAERIYDKLDYELRLWTEEYECSGGPGGKSAMRKKDLQWLQRRRDRLGEEILKLGDRAAAALDELREYERRNF